MKQSEILQRISQGIDYQNRLLKSYIDKKTSKKEIYLISEVIVDAGSYYETPPISNYGYEFMRVFASAGFNAGATSGASVLLYDSNSEMGEIIALRSGREAVGGMSEPIDISAWGGFYFVIKNHDVSKSMTINQIRVTQYNTY